MADTSSATDPASRSSGLQASRTLGEALQALELSHAPMSPAIEAALEAFAKELAHQRALNAQLRRNLAELEQLADTDPLTRVYNRRAFTRELTRHLAYAQRYKVGMALIFIDLDGFKAINDTLGHGAGDRVLKAVGQILTSQIRGSDVVGRMGGDEFAVILPHADAAGARFKATQLAAAVGKAVQVLAPDITIPPAIMAGFGGSQGVALYKQGDDADTLVARADEAMYVAKQMKGRARS